MKSTLKFAALVLAAGGAMLPAITRAASIDLRRDSVVEVVMDDNLTLNGNRAGDRFTAHVENDRDLPRGTRLLGRVVEVRRTRDDRGAMDLEFTDIELPNGSRQRIDAVPVPLTDQYVRRDRNGRFVVNKNVKRKENYVLGGALGGFILGSIFQKQAEGTILGTLAGIVLAETDKGNDGNTVASRGQHMGALLQRDFRADYSDRYGRDDNGGRWDDNRRDDRDSRWGRGDRRDQNNRNGRWSREDGRDDWYGDDVSVSTQTRDLQFRGDASPFKQDGVTLVPLERTANQLRFRVNRERRDDRRVFVDGTDGNLQLEVGSRQARVNDRSITLSTEVVERNGIVFVPIEALAQVSRENLYVNGNRIPRRPF